MMVKGWSKTLELPYRTDYALKISQSKGGSGWVGKRGLVIRNLPKSENAGIFGGLSDKWVVTKRVYNPSGQQYKDLKIFNDKKMAFNFAKSYMKYGR